MSKEEYLNELSKEFNISKVDLLEYIKIVGTNKENIKDYALNCNCAIVRKQGEFNVNYTACMLNEKDQRIAELEEQLKNATHKFNIYQEVYYLDYKYKFEPYVSKYLTVCKGKILDIILREEGCVDYNFTLDDLKWIQEENCFATKEEVEQRLKELKGE